MSTLVQKFATRSNLYARKTTNNDNNVNDSKCDEGRMYAIARIVLGDIRQ